MKNVSLFMIVAILALSLQACSSSRNNTGGDTNSTDTSRTIIPNDTTGMGADTTGTGISPMDTTTKENMPMDTTGRRMNPL